MSVSLLRVLRDAKQNRAGQDNSSQSSTRSAAPLAMVAVYDAPTAQICCEAGADILLVGDSLGNVVLGLDSTIPVTLEMMLHHTGAVARGAKKSSRADVPVVADLPFGSYATVQDAVQSGRTLMQNGAHGLKLEGANASSLNAIRVLVEMGVPVIGHLGFTPQSSLVLNGIVQGRSVEAARQLRDDARRLQDAGCVAVVLEAIPSEVAQVLSADLGIPTIGIGAGGSCDGQVLVWHDLVGFGEGAPFRFVKRYAKAHETLLHATRAFVDEVRSSTFPTRDNEYAMPEDERKLWLMEHEKPFTAENAEVAEKSDL